MKYRKSEPFVALAVGAHPDDVEFMMAGTLLLLKETGADIHIWSLGNGSGGTDRYSKKEIVPMRRKELFEAAHLVGATPHESLFDDYSIFYDAPSLAKVSSVIREIRPNVILTHFPQDYMEDHQNTCRLVITGAFARSSINQRIQPPRAITRQSVAVYHAMPHGLHDTFRQLVNADMFVDTASVISTKRKMLECHQSQKNWLDVTQGMNAYLDEMERISRKMGVMSKKFRHAEAWRQHLQIGLADENYNPLRDRLGRNYLNLKSKK